MYICGNELSYNFYATIRLANYVKPVIDYFAGHRKVAGIGNAAMANEKRS